MVHGHGECAGASLLSPGVCSASCREGVHGTGSQTSKLGGAIAVKRLAQFWLKPRSLSSMLSLSRVLRPHFRIQGFEGPSSAPIEGLELLEC